MTMDTVTPDFKKSLVRKQACFSKLTEDELEQLAELFIPKEFKKGDTIVTEGDVVDSVFLIVQGTVDVQHVLIKDNNTPEVQSVATLKPGDAIGLNDTGFYSLSGRRTATVVANSDLLLLCLSMPSFHGFALSYPHVSEIMRQNAYDSGVKF